ncbi:MAG: arsenite methyltransferase [Omnitrophica WOR_2 bacterium]
MKDKELKEIVREKYDLIAKQSKTQNENSCCGATSCCSLDDYTRFSENYEKIEGYNPEADLGLGCGIPTQFAGIKKGDVVLDLGSGAGNDCFVARSIVGETGKVYGIDFTDAMLIKANANNLKLGYENVEFVKGDIDDMPLSDNLIDVIISNCVLNLVPDKQKAFSEIKRVLKPGGHFCVSDVVIEGALPEKILHDAEMYAGCVSGAIEKDEYLGIITDNGFRDVTVHKSKQIEVPDEILNQYLSAEELKQYRDSGAGLYSITVSATK